MSVARRLVLCRGWRLGALGGARPPHGPAEKFGLLVRLLETVAPTRLAIRFSRLRRALLRRGTLRQRRALGKRRTTFGLRTVPVPTLAIAATVAVAVPPITSVATITPAVSSLVAPERPIVTIAVTILPVAVVPGMPLLLVSRLRLMLGLMLRHLRRLEAVVEHVLAILVAELLTTLARHAAMAVGHISRLTQLLAIRHDDTGVVLGMLEIVLRQHWIARRLSISCERKILLRNVRRRAPDFHIRTV
jgi:hypothetical protein